MIFFPRLSRIFGLAGDHRSSERTTSGRQRRNGRPTDGDSSTTDSIGHRLRDGGQFFIQPLSFFFHPFISVLQNRALQRKIKIRVQKFAKPQTSKVHSGEIRCAISMTFEIILYLNIQRLQWCNF